MAPLADLVTPMAVRVAATLRLADLIAGGVSRVEDLASRSGTDRDALGRLLRHLAGHGVFAEPSPGEFALTDVSSLLRSDHPAGMRTAFALDEFGGRMDLAFTELLHTIRTGMPAWEAAFGTPYWDWLAAHPDMAASFDASMASSTRTTAAGAIDWSGVRHLVDVGGGTGSLVAEVLRSNPDMRATLLDLPGTVARGRAFLAEQGLADRCEFAGQSFFDPLPAGGDVYLLCAVLHDWPDEQATTILRRCAEAARADAEEHGAPTDQRGTDTEEHGAATHQHGADTEERDAATHQHGTPTDHHPADTEEHGAATHQHGTPSDQRSAGAEERGAPTDQRGAATDRRAAAAGAGGSATRAGGAGGRVVIVESHGTAGDDPATFAEMDLRMLVLAGGRERTVEDYSALAARAGLTTAAVHPAGSGLVVIDCRVAR
ncbi:hypothetical protein GCM10009687_18390 [Asanoa iriomotensis]|uniref:O-methyltransferase n=1 Tax=Asanoa iriomotensis TaxID=234613 RepID=A0ABQ4C5W6_9ACTN|nr:hypothetical protein Air01nite_42650 [Asanoa iriomotensis]